MIITLTATWQDFIFSLLLLTVMIDTYLLIDWTALSNKAKKIINKIKLKIKGE